MIRHWFVLLFSVSCFSSPVLADQSYNKRLVEHLNKFKQYPASANARHASGETIVTFSVNREGKIVSSSVVKGSGDLDLDQASLEMLTRAQPLPPFPADLRNNPERFTLPVIFRSKAAVESSSPDIDLSAVMAGKCSSLKIAGRDFTCKSVSYFHTKEGRANFTVLLDDPEDGGHVISFSGANGRKVNDDRYELPIDRLLLNSKNRPKISGLPVPSVEPSAGICKQLGDFSARQVSSVTCAAMDRNGKQYEFAFESDGSPITVKGSTDERISQSTTTISQTPPPSKSSVSLPPMILAATNDEMKDCGAKEIPEAAVTNLDLNGDGINDYIVDFEKIFENVTGCSCGTAGCPREFWVSETGSFVKSFSQKIQGIERIENGPQGRTIILGMHGSACNQVGSKACYFKLTWAGSKAKIEPLNSVDGRKAQPVTYNRYPAEHAAGNSTVSVDHFVFGSSGVANSGNPAERIKIAEQIGPSALKRRFGAYAVRIAKGEDCLTCATILGRPGIIKVDYGPDGKTVTRVTSRDEKSSDTFGNRVGGSLAAAAAAAGAVARHGLQLRQLFVTRAISHELHIVLLYNNYCNGTSRGVLHNHSTSLQANLGSQGTYRWSASPHPLS